MDDTQVDWTKRIDTPPPAPQPSESATTSTPPTTERLQHLEHQVKIGRVLLGVCAGVLALLIVAVVALSAGLFARLDAVVTSVTTLEQQMSSASAGAALGGASAGEGLAGTGTGDADSTGTSGILGDAFGAGTSSNNGQAAGSGAQAADGDTQADGDSEQADPLRASDLTAIVNKKWSNALRILESYGIDQSDLTLVTDDGGAVFNPGNWTVTMVVDLDEPGQVAVYLRHDIDWPW